MSTQHACQTDSLVFLSERAVLLYNVGYASTAGADSYWDWPRSRPHSVATGLRSARTSATVVEDSRDRGVREHDPHQGAGCARLRPRAVLLSLRRSARRRHRARGRGGGRSRCAGRRPACAEPTLAIVACVKHDRRVVSAILVFASTILTPLRSCAAATLPAARCRCRGHRRSSVTRGRHAGCRLPQTLLRRPATGACPGTRRTSRRPCPTRRSKAQPRGRCPTRSSRPGSTRSAAQARHSRRSGSRPTFHAPSSVP